MAQRESSPLPASGLAVVVALLFGYIAVHETTLERFRPTQTEKSSDQLIELQDADARLWQDPFAAVQRHDAELQKILESAKPSQWAQAHIKRHEFKALNAEIEAALKDNPVTILGVTVSSAPYPEDVERRQRYRYAALAGLNRSSFTPDNGDHIGYVVTRSGNGTPACPPNVELLPDKIPYEWFSAEVDRPSERLRNGSAQRRVLLMWLSESTLAKRPVSSLTALAACLGVGASRPDLNIHMLGPMSSDTLRKVVSDNAQKSWAAAPLIRIYSPFATASDAALLQGLAPGTRFPTCEPGSGRGGYVCVVRTITTDDKLATSLVKELELRGVELNAGCDGAPDANCRRDRVALISEWDTFYGRSLPDAIGSVLCPKSPRQCDTIVRKSYLQGMDGSVPGENTPHAAGGNASGKNEQKDVTKETARGERADGRYQFDYLRRLTDEMKQQNRAFGGGQIKAIGILGSDVYDKLLVLQALRSEFPQAQFFTTDVDARLLHPQEFKWARNVVVASGYGLQLRKELQGDVPPFRDTYQTALFFSAMLALAPEGAEGQAQIPGGVQLEQKLLPRLYETGRRHAYALDRDRTNGQCDRYRPLECDSLHPDPPEFVPAAIRHGWIYIPALLLLAVVAFPFYSAFRRHPGVDLEKRLAASEQDRKDGMWARIPLGIARTILANRRAKAIKVFTVAALLLLPLMHLFAAFMLDSPRNEEPLAFYEGISLWPTEALRIYAGLLALFLTYWAMLRMETNQLELTAWFFPQYRTLGIPEYELSRKGIVSAILSNLAPAKLRRILACDLLEGQPIDTPDARLDAKAFWSQYVFHSSMPASAIRTTLASVVFFFFSVSLLWMFGVPHTPYRGELSLVADRIAVLAWSSPLLLFLTFYVLDAALLCKRFVAILSQRQTQWPAETRRHFGAVPGTPAAPNESPDEAYDDWIDIRLIANRTAAISSLVYYPLGVIIVLLFARSTLFDMWHWPLGLVVPLVASLLILFGCHVALRRQAEAARTMAVARVSRRLLVTEGLGEPAEGHTAQLRHMLANIEDIREGAYAPVSQQPLVKALLLFLSASGLAILEYFGVISF